VTTAAFQIQEGHLYAEAVHEVFPGTISPVNGYLYPNQEPGWGIDLDEDLAAKYPPTAHLHERWAARVRRPDGGIEAP
jgi:mannonate dehydratase